jgi:hypothetical protein
MNTPADRCLVGFETADNHGGNFEHELRILRKFHEVCKDLS